MYDFWDTACKGNGSIKYGLVPSADQFISWQIEYNIFLYYLLCMICETMHEIEMVSLNMASSPVCNNLCAGKLCLSSFFIIFDV